MSAVDSYRNGAFIDSHRKDFIVNVTDCDFAGAQLDPQACIRAMALMCLLQTLIIHLITKLFSGTFGDPASGSADTSTLSKPNTCVF